MGKRKLKELRQIVTRAAFRDFMNDTGYKEIEAIPSEVWQRLCQLDPVVAATAYRYAREAIRQYKAIKRAEQQPSERERYLACAKSAEDYAAECRRKAEQAA